MRRHLISMIFADKKTALLRPRITQCQPLVLLPKVLVLTTLSDDYKSSSVTARPSICLVMNRAQL